MANGYIGKISAVVTANTSDLSRKLSGAVGDVDKFANRLNRSIRAAADSAAGAFDKIFTPLQRLERSFQGALKFNLRTEGEINKIRALVSVAEDISKPLASAAKSFTGLSRTVAAEFQPALVRAQGQVQFIEKQFDVFGRVSESVFNRVTRNVEKTTVAINQLREASALVRGLPTGNELAFSDPRLSANLQAAQKAGRQALSLPASTIAGDPQIEGLTRQIARVSELSVAAAARVKAAVAPNELAAARQESDRLNAVLESLVAKLNKKYAVVIDAQKAIADATSLNQRLDELQENATFSITGTPQNLKQVEAELVRILGQFDKLTEAQRQPLGDPFTKVVESLRAGNLPESIQNFQALAASVELAANETERLARANKQLTIAPDQPPQPPAGASTRLIDRVAPSVTALRDRIVGLADPLRESLGPQIDQINNRFRLLARDGVGTTGEAVQRLRADIASLNAALDSRRSIGDNFAASFGGAGVAGLGLGIDERSLRAIGGQIEFVQNRLSLLGQEARGPVLAALEALRVRANALFQGGALDTEEARNELALLRQDLIRTLAAAEGGGTSGIEAGLRRAGDVGRLGVDKLQLGLQQAAFAVDDFFSVTGDLQQRIRAVGNNLTQLGFIVGQTKGLWIALGGVLALQVISQIIKYANANVEAADRTKALNEALARQKSLVEELAQAFRSLGDTILQGVFTPAAEDARKFAQALEEIRKKQAEVRESRLTEFNPDVVQRRAETTARQREFDAATDPASRLAAATALRQARDREREAIAAATRPIPARRLDDEIQQAVQRSIDIERSARTDPESGFLPNLDSLNEAIRRGGRQAEIAAARAAGDGLGANRIQREELQTRLREVEALGDGPDSRQAALILRQALDRLDFAEALGLDDAAREIFKDAQGTATGIREARERLSEAIEAGVPGARQASDALNAAGESLSAAQQRIIDRIEAGLPVDRELVDAARTEREAAQKALEARQKEVATIDSTRRSLETFSAALDRVSTQLANTVAQEARGLADQARRDANREQGIVDAGLGGRQGDADAAAQRRARLEAEADDFARRAAGIEAANTRARIDFERQAQAGGLGGRAQELIRRRDAAQAVIDNQQSPAEAVINAQATLNVINTELQQIFEQSGAGQAAAKLADELNKAAAAVARLDELTQRGRELDRTPAEQAGRALAEDIRAIQERLAADTPAPFDDGDRGRIEFAPDALRDLATQGGEAARKEAARLRLQGGAERNAAADLLENAAADIARVREDAFRQQAPAIFGLADQVANAVLQGPSRAALEATDVSTVEGARELNRLLRGDDAARNQDLVELQKQSRSLEELVQLARAQGVAGVAD